MSYNPPGYYPPGYFPDGYMPGEGDGVIIPDSNLRWDGDNASWSGTELAYGESKPVLLVGNQFYQVDSSDLFAAESIEVTLERVGLTIYGRDHRGNLRSDPRLVKLLRELWPVFRGQAGTVLTFHVGGQTQPNGPVTWQGPFPFILGTSLSVQPLLSTTHLAYRISSINQPPWSLVSLDFDLEVVGVVPT